MSKPQVPNPTAEPWSSWSTRIALAWLVVLITLSLTGLLLYHAGVAPITER